MFAKHYTQAKKLTYVFLLNLTYPLSRLEPRRSPLADLEVATDSPLCPTVAIISPTPRAFTFPPIIKDLPLPSPSSSPFKPDLKPLSTPPPMRTLSPTSTIDSSETSSVYSSSVYSSSVSTVSSQASHRRRRSVASDTERRPKKGDDDYIKRPENAFILFRRKCCEDRQMAEESAHEDPAAAPAKKQRQADLSKMISQQWKSLSAEERAHWEDLAKEKKKEHEQLYPNYVYRPQRVKDKSKGAKKGKGRKDGEGDTEPETMLSFVVPIPAPRNSSNERSHGSNRRAASAPTPPPQYQTVSIPAVYLPSCPSSPALIPRISRRTPLPRYPIPSPEDADPSTHFEYLPNDSFQPTSFQPRPSFDANMTVSLLTFQFTHFHFLTISTCHPFLLSTLIPLYSLPLVIWCLSRVVTAQRFVPDLPVWGPIRGQEPRASTSITYHPSRVDNVHDLEPHFPLRISTVRYHVSRRIHRILTTLVQWSLHSCRCTFHVPLVARESTERIWGVYS